MKLTGHKTVAVFTHYIVSLWKGIDRYTRYGYIFEFDMTHILKRKDFARWQADVLSEVHCEQDH